MSGNYEESSPEEVAIKWPDNRYAVFSLGVALLAAIFFAFILNQINITDQNWSAGVVFVAVLFILQPLTKPNVKPKVTALLFGERIPIGTHHSFKREYEKNVIKVLNPEGDCEIYKKIRLANSDSGGMLSKYAHEFAFGDGVLVYDFFTDGDDDGEEYPVQCTCLDTDLNMDIEPLVESEHKFEYLLHFPRAISPNTTYEYEMKLGRAEGAFPIEDEEDTWTVKSLEPLDELEVVVQYDFDLADVQILGKELIDTRKDEIIVVPETDYQTGQISLTVHDLHPGNYKLSWLKQRDRDTIDR